LEAISAVGPRFNHNSFEWLLVTNGP
jgi:hypothetical protein